MKNETDKMRALLKAATALESAYDKNTHSEVEGGKHTMSSMVENLADSSLYELRRYMRKGGFAMVIVHNINGSLFFEVPDKGAA